MKHLTADPDLSAVPQPYRAIIERAMRKDPEKRFKNVAEMVALLDASKVNDAKPHAGVINIPVPVTPQASKLAFNGAPERIVEAKVTIVKNTEPHYIGDDEKEMAFGPVKKNSKQTQIPPVRQGANGHRPGPVPGQRPSYVPGSYAALPVAPRAEEPIASAVSRGFSSFGQSGEGMIFAGAPTSCVQQKIPRNGVSPVIVAWGCHARFHTGSCASFHTRGSPGLKRQPWGPVSGA